MKKIEPTPGEWRVNSGMVETINGIPLAHMDRTPGNGTMPVERDANAHLMAASKLLLAALRNTRLELSQMHATYCKGCKEGCPTLAYIDAADQAIAKAIYS